MALLESHANGLDLITGRSVIPGERSTGSRLRKDMEALDKRLEIDFGNNGSVLISDDGLED